MILSQACRAGEHTRCESDLEAFGVGTDLCSCPCHDIDSQFDADELGEDPEWSDDQHLW